MSQRARLEYPATINQEVKAKAVVAGTAQNRNELFALALSGTVELRSLEKALRRVMERHEALRTALLCENGNWMQRVEHPADCGTPLFTVDARASSVRGSDLYRAVSAHMEIPFDLHQAPLFRAVLVSGLNDEHVLCMIVDRFIIDGWSMNVFWRELMQLYDAESRGRHLDLPAPAAQLGTFAVWERQRLAGPRLELLRTFWRRTLSPPPAPLVWTRSPERPNRFTYRSKSVKGSLSSELWIQVLAFARQHFLTPFTVLNTILLASLMRWCKERDFLLHTVMANRHSKQFENTIGWLSNGILLRNALPPELDRGRVVAANRATILRARAYGELPIGLAMGIVGTPASKEFAFRSQVSHQHSVATEFHDVLPIGLDKFPEAIWLPAAAEAHWPYDIALSSYLNSQGVELEFWYNVDLFSLRAANSMSAEFTEMAAWLCHFTPAERIA
jgi:hypothetical protein